MRNKLVTKGARHAARHIAGSLTRDWKQSVHRAYRRRVRQIDHTDEAADYEPPSRCRITAYDVC